MVDNAPGIPEKWIDGLAADAPVTDAAQKVLPQRVESVPKIVKTIVKSHAEDDDAVHQLRVSTRRAQAAILSFKPWLRKGRRQAAKKALKRLRDAAGVVRMCDVHRGLLSEMAGGAGEERLAAEAALALLEVDRHTALHDLFDAAKRTSNKKALEKGGRWVKRGAKECKKEEALQGMEAAAASASAATGEASPATDLCLDLRSAGDAALAELAGDFLTAADEDLSQRENLHRMRLQGKRLRYAIEIFGATSVRRESLVRMNEALISLQERLGSINDYHEVAERLSRYAQAVDSARSAVSQEQQPSRQEGAEQPSLLSPVMKVLAARFEARCIEGAAAFLEWWRSEDAADFQGLMRDLAGKNVEVEDRRGEAVEDQAQAAAREDDGERRDEGEGGRSESAGDAEEEVEVVVMVHRNGDSAVTVPNDNRDADQDDEEGDR